MSKVVLKDEAQQIIAKMKARFFIIQPDGMIKRRGAWAFNIEANARYAAAGTDAKVYDRETGEFLTDAPLTDAAVITPVKTVEPVIVAQASGDQPIGDGSRLPGDVLTAAEHSKAFPGGESIVPDEAAIAADLKPGDTEVHIENDHQPSPTPILDKMIEVLADGKPRGKRNGRSKKDGKPTGAKVHRGAVIRRK